MLVFFLLIVLLILVALLLGFLGPGRVSTRHLHAQAFVAAPLRARRAVPRSHALCRRQGITTASFMLRVRRWAWQEKLLLHGELLRLHWCACPRRSRDRRHSRL